ncbi:hypothetical protein C8F04DRAFT_1110130 [Mycena alexandri]|uniref:Uncharacterized protein n=1 Tax=Mycena alexandri TaxID=1745969 RepID=A0AAD6X041_9AGAR|nr:hypothetical protein C8F04DRAFT_1110130 [Mycena alexandri]
MASLRRRVEGRREAPRRPAPSHRHAGPSAPWPWINLHDEIDPLQLASPAQPVPEPCDHTSCDGCWQGYPQSRFPNWTPSQVRRSRIHKAITDYTNAEPSIIHYVDVDSNGFFTDSGKLVTDDTTKEELWNTLINEGSQRPGNIRVRALFIEHLTGPVLMMLGATYNIEPFFFSSSLGWIPSRYQEEVRPKQGDHITITLTFLRTLDHPRASSLHTFLSDSASSTMTSHYDLQADQVIDTQAPLFLYSSDHYLILDLLAVHLIRGVDGNTIISYHNTDTDTTSAKYLHERIRFAGQSVYWQGIFQKSPDPTFILLTFLWHALYAWDESLELLYSHICYIEAQVINTSDLLLTRELHIIRAHHLHYSALLEDFRKAVAFVRDTSNPAMDALPEEERTFSRGLLERECKNLLSEISRLELGRSMQDKRLKNVMNLVFSSVNIEDSKRMQQLTEAAVRDSAGASMKQIAYLSMVFLPASFVAAIFGMNIRELSSDTLGSLPHYFATALPLTMVTVWVVMTFQSKHLLGQDTTVWMQLFWPVSIVRQMIQRRRDAAARYDLDAPDWKDRKEEHR